MNRRSNRLARLVAIAIVPAFAFSCASDRSPQSDDRYADRVREGDEAVAQGDFQKAIQIGDDILAADKANRAALNLVYRARLAELEARKDAAEREKKLSHERGLVDADEASELPREAPVLDRAQIVLRSGLTKDSIADVEKKLTHKVDGMNLVDADLDFVLQEIFKVAEINVAVDPKLLAGKKLTLRGKDLTVRYMLEYVSRTHGLQFTLDNENVWITSAKDPVFVTRMYRLDRGLSTSEIGDNYNVLGTLGFLGSITGSASQKSTIGGVGGSGSIGSTSGRIPGAGNRREQEKSFEELFLEKLPHLVSHWPEGSEYFLDKKKNVVVVKSSREGVAEVEDLLKEIDTTPLQVGIETRFIEIRGRENLDLGVDFNFPNGAVFNRKHDVRFDTGTGTFFGVPQGFGDPLNGGTNVVVRGVLSDPQFEAFLFTLDRTDFGNVLASPQVTTANNNSATIAITRNLAFIESFEAVFDQRLQTTPGGVTTQDANVAFVARINDQNFTGIVLNVTPSIGADGKHINLMLQPVAKEQVDEIEIKNVVVAPTAPNGTADPNDPNSGSTPTAPSLTRPILETRFINTQLTIEDGATVVLGGLISERDRKVENKTPLLGDLPVLGWLFRRETTVHEKSNLYIFVRAKILGPAGETYRDARKAAGG
ncbi:MAG: hypothetical protein HYR85_27645 [Planctomycetes bacterium]|nr:hypothetical protein [Planctomycetota bacterium]MBI3844245.1 hypothetical protein [Planctomycetota bacterium]